MGEEEKAGMVCNGPNHFKVLVKASMPHIGVLKNRINFNILDNLASPHQLNFKLTLPQYTFGIINLLKKRSWPNIQMADSLILKLS